MDLLDRLLGHDRWTTSRVLDHCEPLTDAQLDQRFDIGLGTLRETLDHTIYTVAFWTGLMIGQPANESREDRSVAALRDRHERFYSRFERVALQMRDEQRLDETFIDHYQYRQTMGATILQVTMHNQQHRNEARHILERLGVPDLWDLDPQEWERSTQNIDQAVDQT